MYTSIRRLIYWRVDVSYSYRYLSFGIFWIIRKAKKIVYCGGPFTDGLRQLSEGKDVKPMVNASGGDLKDKGPHMAFTSHKSYLREPLRETGEICKGRATRCIKSKTLSLFNKDLVLVQ